MSVTLKLDKEYLLNKYVQNKELRIRERLEYGYPFVLSHANIVDFLDGANPILRSDYMALRKAEITWRNLIKYVSSLGQERPPTSHKLIVVGIYRAGYGDIYAFTSIPPSPPFVPSEFGIVAKNKTIVVRPERKRDYVNFLRLLIKAVIVKSISSM